MKKNRWMAGMLLAALMTSLLTPVSAQGAETTAEVTVAGIAKNDSYEEYLEKYAAYVGEDDLVDTLTVKSGEFLEKSGKTTVLAERNGKQQVLLLEEGEASASFELFVKNSGWYRLAVDYAQTENTSSQILIGVAINGSIPFSEAAELELPRIFKDAGEIRIDSVGNEIAPKQEQVLDWQTAYARNTSGYYTEDYLFYLEEGNNSITISNNGKEFLLAGFSFCPMERVMSYEQYLATQNGKETSGYFIKIQAEDAKEKSASVLTPNYDRTNAATEDQYGEKNNAKYIRINTIGGSLWQTSGQWISWEITVPEDGFYNIGMKFRQNYLDGLFTSRDVLIDDQILFDGMQGVQFKYDDEWQTMTLSDEMGTPYKLYLTSGTHEIKLRCTMGEFSDTLRILNESIYEINDLYRRIIMITSTDPDSYTDYFLTDRVPDLMATMERNKVVLEEQIEKITAISGGKGSKTAVLETLKVQLELFLTEPEEITKRLSTFKNNISAMGSWIVDIQAQGLQLDYLYLKSADVETPKAESGFFTRIWYSVCRFFASFDGEASSLSSKTQEGVQSVKVWVSTGRDQAQVLKDLIDESFTPETGIEVDLQLVQGSLIEATLAGRGPDVALMIAEDQPVNFAIRGALQDLSEFDDYEKILERFYDSSMEPFWYEGGLYALPDTQVFDMLFYRTDVFEDLEITVPSTWDEFYAILPTIQRNNLQITVQDIFATLLYQNGGSYYNETGTRALFDTQTAVNAMTKYTDLYTSYGFEVKTDFYSRFRSGELVMSIQPYSMYNQLMVAAPEIKGLWAMAPIPGTVLEDGTINRAQSSSMTGSVMLASAQDKEAAWEFMKWWSSDEVKASYGIALEGLMGASARFTPANIGTLEMLPWSAKELVALEEARICLVGIPQLPGSYYTSRGLTNAFRNIVYSGEFPNSVMRLQNRYINEEITRKREEFGLITYEKEAQQ